MNPIVEPVLGIDGGRPAQEQLERQLRHQILAGILRPGEELPTVREVAVGLVLNPGAVEEAYRRLEQEGYLLRGEKAGPSVADSSIRPRASDLHALCRDFLERMAAHGYSVAEVLHTLHASGKE